MDMGGTDVMIESTGIRVTLELLLCGSQVSREGIKKHRRE